MTCLIFEGNCAGLGLKGFWPRVAASKSPAEESAWANANLNDIRTGLQQVPRRFCRDDVACGIPRHRAGGVEAGPRDLGRPARGEHPLQRPGAGGDVHARDNERHIADGNVALVQLAAWLARP